MRGKGLPPLSEGGTSSAVQFMLQSSPRDQIEASLSAATSLLSPSLLSPEGASQKPWAPEYTS